MNLSRTQPWEANIVDLRTIWRQDAIPVVSIDDDRPSDKKKADGEKLPPLLIKLPKANDNLTWLRNGKSRIPEWILKFNCWSVPRSWLRDVVYRALQRHGNAYVIQPFREQERCAKVCWTAKKIECTCSCLGAHHGSLNPANGWFEISDTCAVRYGDRKLGCRLLTASLH